MSASRPLIRAPSARGTFAGLFDDISVALIAILATLLPVVFVPSFDSEFYIPKMAILLIVGVALAALAALRMIRVAETRRYLPMDAAVTIFALAILVSFLFSASPATSFFGRYYYPEGVMTLCGYLLLYVGASRVAWSRRRLRVAGWGAAVGAALVCGYAFVQLIGLDPLTWKYSFNSQRIASTLGNPTELAAYLSVIAPFVALMLVFGGRITRVISILVLTSVAAALWASQGKAGILAILAASGVMLAIRLRMRVPDSNRLDAELGASQNSKIRLVLGMLGVLVLLAISALGAQALRPIDEKVISPFEFAKLGPPAADSVDDRLNIWASSLSMIAARPVSGWGPDLFELKFPQYQTLASARIESAGGELGRRAEDAHNVFLEYAATLGLVGLTSFMGVLLLAFSCAARAAAYRPRGGHDLKGDRHESRIAWTGTLLTGALVAFLVSAMLTPLTMASATFFWLAVGMLSSISGTSAESSRATFARVPVRAALVAVGAAACSVLLVAAIIDLASESRQASAEDLWAVQRGDLALPIYADAARVNPWRDNYQGQYGLRLSNYGIQMGDDSVTERGLAVLESARAKNPSEANYPLIIGRIILKPGSGRAEALRARAFIRIGSRLAPNDSRGAIFLGESLAITRAPGEEAEEERAWTRAIAIAPELVPAWKGLAALYLRTGRTEDAERAYHEVLRITPGDAEAERIIGSASTDP